MAKWFTRLIIVLGVAGAFFWYFTPNSVGSAANALITTVDDTISQAHGIAQFVAENINQKDKAGNLQVKMDELKPNTSYEVTLDQGQCGAVGKDLGVVLTDDNGSFDHNFPLSGLIPDSTWYVDIHEHSADGPSIACGQLQTNSSVAPQVVGPFANSQDQTPTPDTSVGSTPAPSAGSTPNPTGTPQGGLPNGMPKTGVNPGDDQQYDNNTYPRKY